MNTADEYIYRVYTEKSFTQAAKSLFISQPSLSAAIARKEEELGFRIFDRSTKPISLTPQGHVYLDMLEEVTASERTMHLRIQRLSDGKHSSLTVGGSSASAYYLIPTVCGAFYRRYPEISVNVDLGNFGAVSALIERASHFEKLERDELDLVFSYEYDTNKHCGHEICRERLVVAMHRDLITDELFPYALTQEMLLSGEFSKEKEIPHKNFFRDIPFLDFARTSNTGRYMYDLLGDYRTSSHKISYARHSVVHFNMVCAGVGAMLTSDCMVALSNAAPEDVFYFSFPRLISERSIYAVEKKNAVRAQPARYFIELAKQICRNGIPRNRYTNG